MTIRICMWSGPRNLSTAMMRSFGARDDCDVWDEPFFAAYMKATNTDQPGRKETLALCETDPEKVAKDCIGPAPQGAFLYFQKHMPHQMADGFPLDWVGQARHFFLIRDPQRVVASYAQKRPEFNSDELGFRAQRVLYDFITDKTGMRPPVIDSTEILTAPDKMLRILCDALDIPFQKAMLSWKMGIHESDGPWAPYWYQSVAASTSFAPAPTSMPTIENRYENIVAACRDDYETLYEARLKAL